MTAGEWETSDLPRKMLNLALRLRTAADDERVDISDRKLRLYACGISRLTWDDLNDSRWRNAVEVGERYAEGKTTLEELGYAWGEANRANRPDQKNYTSESVVAATCAAWPLDLVNTLPNWLHYCNKPQSDLLRCVLGELRRAGHSWAGDGCVRCGMLRTTFENIPKSSRTKVLGRARCPGIKAVWRHPEVLGLAKAAYEQPIAMACVAGCESGKFIRNNGEAFDCLTCGGTGHSPGGLLDNARLLVLADALLDVGCNDAGMQGHLRNAGPHCKGCWPLDLILGKK